MSETNWSKIIEQIKNIKYPLAFFYRIIVIKDQINDYELGIIFSHYLNYHISICFDNPLFILATNLKKSHPYSWKVLSNFYSSCYYIILSTVNLIQLRICYRKKYLIEWAAWLVLAAAPENDPVTTAVDRFGVVLDLVSP